MYIINDFSRYGTFCKLFFIFGPNATSEIVIEMRSRYMIIYGLQILLVYIKSYKSDVN